MTTKSKATKPDKVKVTPIFQSIYRGDEAATRAGLAAVEAAVAASALLGTRSSFKVERFFDRALYIASISQQEVVVAKGVGMAVVDLLRLEGQDPAWFIEMVKRRRQLFPVIVDVIARLSIALKSSAFWAQRARDMGFSDAMNKIEGLPAYTRR
jgi:hypothetical protein